MMSNSRDWTWKFAPVAPDQFESLDAHVQDRIVSKLDEIVDSEWREPDDFLEPSPVEQSRNSASANIDSAVS